MKVERWEEPTSKVRRNAYVYIGALDVFVAKTVFRRAADKEEAHGFKAVS